MTEVELTRTRLVKIWWLMAWRGALGGFLIGAVIGGITGALAAIVASAVFHVPYDEASYKQIAQMSSLAVSIPIAFGWWIYNIRMMLRKKYKDFRIALVPLDS